jgi:hypothetical protein
MAQITPFGETTGLGRIFEGVLPELRERGLLADPEKASEKLSEIFGVPTGTTPSETIGLAASERIAGPSIFEQLDLINRAQELTTFPGFEQRTPEQEALIQELIGITGGATAVRGLGAPTAGAIASQIAPTLAGFRQQNIMNQLAALQGLTGAAGIGATERIGGIQSLLDLFGLSLPTPVIETGGEDSTFSDITSLLTTFAGLF